MAKIFISYAREDEKIAEEIHDTLVGEGHSVWLDRKMLLPGSNWKMEIEKAIQESDIFVACISRNSVDKVGFVQAELRRAMEVADLMPEDKIFIIPIRLDDCKVPFLLQKFQWVNYFETGGADSLFRSIRSRSNVEQEFAATVTEYLLRNSAEGIQERFAGVSPLNLKQALLSVAKRGDELTSVRKRAVRALSLLRALDAEAWSELLPAASPELVQDWITAWGTDEDETVLSATHIDLLLAARTLPKASAGFGKAVRKFIGRGAAYTSAVLLPASKYPSWEVKLDCVRTIIHLDDRDSIKTLEAFSSMSYFVARANIIEYIERKFDAGLLSAEDLEIAIGIADRFVSDGKTKPKTPTMRRSRELLAKLKGADD